MREIGPVETVEQFDTGRHAPWSRQAVPRVCNSCAVFDAGLRINSGTLNGTGDITVSNASLDWNGGTIGGSGTIGGLAVATTAAKTLDSKAMVLASDTVWSSSGMWRLSNGAQITNQATRTFDIQANLNLDDPTFLSGTETFTNFGIVQKSALTGCPI